MTCVKSSSLLSITRATTFSQASVISYLITAIEPDWSHTQVWPSYLCLTWQSKKLFKMQIDIISCLKSLMVLIALR